MWCKIKLVRLSLCLLSMIFFINVRADEIYYTNSNGVSLTKEQYNFLGELHFDGYQDYITEGKHNKYLSMGLYDEKVNKKVIEEFDDNNNLLYGTLHETTAKKLVLSYVCASDFCNMITTLYWKGAPVVRSYDVIGSYLYGNLSRVSYPITYLYWSGTAIEFTDRVYSGNGYGCSVLLQNSSVPMIIEQDIDITVNGHGTFYSSYQHATRKISLETSKKYTTGFGGDGGVFFFYGSAIDVYDQMAGVDIHLS